MREIDIMSMSATTSKIHHNVHTLGSKQTDVGAMNTGTSINVSDAYTQFHVFALERTADTMKFFIDGKLTYTYKKDAAHPDYWHGMDQPHYLLINLAIGGSWGGQQGVDDSIFCKYYIGYVRYYVAADSAQIRFALRQRPQ
ncbi:MAG: glycoside hydrolase family 16 protein [Bacilli bacterium]